MKYIMLLCMLSIKTTGLCVGNRANTINTNTIVEKNDSETFLTAFIEGDQVYLNIPVQLLDIHMMFVRYDQDYEHKYMQVMWSKQKDNILLMVPSIKSTAGIILPIEPKLTLSENIINVFKVDDDRSISMRYCINITDFILNEVIPWSSDFEESVVPKISMILGTKDLKNEVMIKTRRGILMDGSKIAFPMVFAFSLLDEPMNARNYDYRMGFYNERVNDIYYGRENRIANISRWRLEKKYPDQELSVPKKPITFSLSPSIPPQWRSYVKAGIEEWLPAFESAGFKEALVIKEVDSISEWDMYSINTNMVYWGAKNTWRGTEEGGFGGTVTNIIDERTGEIVKGDVYMGTSREAYSEMYFIRAAPLDNRAQTFPFPDNLLGELYQCMVAHEVGHIFGLMDGNYGEFAYPFEKMNDVKWLETMGHTPSVMNYTRQNNIAQPEDNIPPALLNQKVGPMDHYQIQWGYKEFPSGTTIEDVDADLELLIRLQDSIPWYRFNVGLGDSGPATTAEVVESRDPIRGTEMAFKNMERAMALLPNACRDQKDNARLERIYARILELWQAQLQQVAALIGGYDIQFKSINQTGKRFEPIALEVQRKALNFILEHTLNPPKWLTNPTFESRINNSVNRDKILEYQIGLILKLIEPVRLKRLEYLDGQSNYQGILQEYLKSLQSKIFQGLYNANEVIHPRNREVQLIYIDMVVRALNQERLHVSVDEKLYDYTDYAKGLLTGQLVHLKKDIILEAKRNKNKDLEGHWKLCLLKLKDIP